MSEYDRTNANESEDEAKFHREMALEKIRIQKELALEKSRFRQAIILAIITTVGAFIGGRLTNKDSQPAGKPTTDPASTAPTQQPAILTRMDVEEMKKQLESAREKNARLQNSIRILDPLVKEKPTKTDQITYTFALKNISIMNPDVKIYAAMERARDEGKVKDLDDLILEFVYQDLKP